MKFKCIFFLLLSISFTFSNTGYAASNTDLPQIRDGVLDLRQYQLANEILPLDGEWKFYWKQLLNPNHPTGENPVNVSVPGYWDGLNVSGQTIGADGYATYHLKILLPSKSRDLGFKIQKQSTAYQLYVNGSLLMSNGQVGKTAVTSTPDIIPREAYITADSKILNIILHISNFHYKKGGASRKILFGKREAIQKYGHNSLALNLFLFGCIFVMGFYHIGFYINRKEDKSPLYFSYFCFLIAIRDLVTNEFFLKQMYPSIPWEIIEKLRYLTFYLCVPIFSYYLEVLFTDYFPVRFLKIVKWVGFLSSIPILFLKAKFYTETSAFFEAFFIIITCMALYFVFQAARDGHKGAKTFLIGFLVLFISALNDILFHEGIFGLSKDITPLGLLFFILMQSWLLSKRFARAFTAIEALSAQLEVKSQELAEKNIRLKNYGERMEVLVKKRTSTLKNTLKEVEETQEKIMDSLNYSKIIQTSLLPDKQNLKQQLPNSFLVWKPKDIVGGDIIFAEHLENKLLLAVVDCTGHGVPGAFMTMVASSGLQKIINDLNCIDPSEILKLLNQNIKTLLRQDVDRTISDNGLEASVCLLNLEAKTIVFAGAGLPLYYIKNGKFNIIKGDRHSIGYKRSDPDFNFRKHELQIDEGMCFYLCTDGYYQQLGGEKNISFGKKRLGKLLTDIHLKPFDDQKYQIMQVFNEHRGQNEIQDDVTFFGFKL